MWLVKQCSLMIILFHLITSFVARYVWMPSILHHKLQSTHALLITCHGKKDFYWPCGFVAARTCYESFTEWPKWSTAEYPIKHLMVKRPAYFPASQGTQDADITWNITCPIYGVLNTSMKYGNNINTENGTKGRYTDVRRTLLVIQMIMVIITTTLIMIIHSNNLAFDKTLLFFVGAINISLFFLLLNEYVLPLTYFICCKKMI